MPTVVDRECNVMNVMNVKDPYGRILGFSDCLQVAPVQ
jgi:hypothetical protein